MTRRLREERRSERHIGAVQYEIGTCVIGPAEVEEMMAEYAEANRRDRSALTAEKSWPIFIANDHLDLADKNLIGSHRQWIASLAERSE